LTVALQLCVSLINLAAATEALSRRHCRTSASAAEELHLGPFSLVTKSLCSE
jgi:hypothetical protein